MKEDSSAVKYNLCLTLILDASVMSLNKLNVTESSSTLHYVMLTKCWLNVGQPSDMHVQH